MSQPTFENIDKDISRDSAFNMILASIAMEELALSHIINAEGEKLQYVLGNKPCNRYGSSNKDNGNIDDILAVNKSITQLLEIVSENQILLKNKMNNILHAISEERPKPCPCPPEPPCPCPPEPPCPCPPEPPCPPPIPPCPPPEPYRPHCKCPEKCSAVFKGAGCGEIWRDGCPLRWNCESIHGKCVSFRPHDNTKILLTCKGRFMVSFSLNIKSRFDAEKSVISLRTAHANCRSEAFSYHCPVVCPDVESTAAASGIIVEVPDHCGVVSLSLELVSPAALITDKAMLSIVEI